VDDEPLTRRELAVALGEILGRRAPKVVPRWLAMLGGGIGETVARSLRVSNRKLREASGWGPRWRSGREGWRAAASGLRAGGTR
jgi:2-alkyl-3-oxoalkanoate reductase